MKVRIVGSDTPRVRNMRRHLVHSGHEVVELAADLVIVEGAHLAQALKSRMRAKVIVDHFIPLHEKYIEDQQRWGRRSPRALALRLLDIAACWVGNAVIVDSPEHGDRLHRMSLRPRRAFHYYPPSSTLPAPTTPVHAGLDVVWIGHGTRFHGTERIAEAVTRSGLRAEITSSIAAPDAANLLASAKVALGVFGIESPKAHRVIPYKVLDAMALGIPVVTARTKSTARLERSGVVLVEPTDDLAQVLTDLVADEPRRAELGKRARAAYLAEYDDEAQSVRLGDIVAAVTR
jgi:hypothetical protein